MLTSNPYLVSHLSFRFLYLCQVCMHILYTHGQYLLYFTSIQLRELIKRRKSRVPLPFLSKVGAYVAHGCNAHTSQWLAFPICRTTLPSLVGHNTHTQNLQQTHNTGTFMHQNEKRQGVLILTGGSERICNFLSVANYSGNKTLEKWRLLV